MRTALNDAAARGLFDNARLAIEVIVRPPRSHYDLEDLGPVVLDDPHPPVPQLPMRFRNRRGQTIVGSLYPSTSNCFERVILYLHGNVGSQREGRFIVPFFTPHGISVFLFDFAGSGESQGEFVSLGGTESDDILDTIDFLSSQFLMTQFVLWGRSMGASAALLAAPKDDRIVGIIADSAFSSLDDLFSDISARIHIPSIFRAVAIAWIKRSVLKITGLDCGLVSPVRAAQLCKVPLLLGHSLHDEFVPYREALAVFENYGGAQKTMIPFNGRHNSARAREWNMECIKFVCERFGLDIDVAQIADVEQCPTHARDALDLLDRQERHCE
jgi:pimeloyl-ACP methyl ester carboxylesterase